MAEMTMDEFNAKVQRWAAEFPKAAQAGLKRAAEAVYTEVTTKHLSGPTGRKSLSVRSGDLKSSISTSVRRAGTKMTAEIGNLKHPLKYAKIHEYGGIIRPKNGQFLRFKIGNTWIFAKEVKIPERSYLRSSLEAKRQDIKDILTKAMRDSYRDA